MKISKLLSFLFLLFVNSLFAMQKEIPDKGDFLYLSDVLSKYDINLLGLMSQGKEKLVYKVSKDGEFAACSHFLPRADIPGEELDKMKFESYVLNEYKHKNIIRQLYCLYEDGPCLLFTELGRSDLKTYLEENKNISFKEKVRIAKDILSGVEYLHLNSVIHGDLKPHNIVVLENGKAVLIDLTFLKKIGCQYDYWQGTYFFMPPEYLEKVLDEKLGESYEFKDITSEKFDIFAIGAILYWIFYRGRIDKDLQKYALTIGFEQEDFQLNVKNPKSVDYIKLYLDRLKKDTIVFFREVIPRENDQINFLIKKCLSFDPEKRPTATEIFNELDEIYKSLINRSSEIVLDFSSINKDSIDWNKIIELGGMPEI